MSTKTLTIYRITASYLQSGTRVDCTDHPTLGEHLSSRWLQRREAGEAAAELTDTLAEFGLDATTEYRVERDDVTISHVRYDAESSVVSAKVDGRDATWLVQAHHTGAGIDGLEVVPDSSAMHRFGFGNKFDAEVSSLVLGMVRLQATDEGMVPC